MPPPGDYTLTPVEHDPWAQAQTHQAERPNPAAPIVNFGKLFAKTMADRAISAVTAPRDALYGTMQVMDPETGMPTQEAMQRGQGVANLAMTGGIPFAKQGAAGAFGGKLTQATQPAAEPTYSALGKAVEGAKQPVAQPEQWLGFLKNQPGVKAQEIEHVGLEPWLKSQQGPVSREAVGEFVQGKQPEIREIRKGSAGPEYSQALQETQKAFDEFQATARGTPEADAAFERFNAATEAAEALKPGRSKFESYQLPGGSNYGETLLTLPERRPQRLQEIDRRLNEITELPSREHTPATAAEFDALRNERGTINHVPDAYQSSHWDEPNVLLHTRHNDRTVPGPNGEPMNSLHLEEIQSDWHQAGRKHGYNEDVLPEDRLRRRMGLLSERDRLAGEVAERNLPVEHPHWTRINQINSALEGGGFSAARVPDAPFKTTWPDLALKRMLHRASTERNPDGSYKYDAMSWTPGEAQAERYDLSKQIGELYHWKDEEGRIGLSAYDHNDHAVLDQHYTMPEKLPDVIGKEMAEKILKGEGHVAKDQPEGVKVFSGLDLKVGGEGMKAFYDKMLPDKANALVKKFGAKVERTNTDARRRDAMGRVSNQGEREQPVHVLRITPALRAAAEKGFPTFAIGGAAALGNYQLTPVDHDPFNQ